MKNDYPNFQSAKCAKLKSVFSSDNFKTVSIEHALNEIKECVYQPYLAKLPPATSTKEYKEAKQKLPAYAFNGAFFDNVKNENFVESSGFFHFDVDNLPNAKDIKNAIKSGVVEIPELFALWESPSGNGLKGLIRIPDDLIHTDAEFKKAFKQIAKYLKECGLEIDKSCKDVRRLCFVCADADIYINRNATAFLFDLSEWHEQPKPIDRSGALRPGARGSGARRSSHCAPDRRGKPGDPRSHRTPYACKCKKLDIYTFLEMEPRRAPSPQSFF